MYSSLRRCYAPQCARWIGASVVGSRFLSTTGKVAASRGETAAATATAATAAPRTVAAEEVLPGVELARRVADPSAEFPATWSSNEPLGESDPRIEWRELYNLETEKPYYHNVKTNEVTDSIPDGFVTRFPLLYRRSNEHRVDEGGAVFRVQPDKAGAAPTEAAGKLSMKQRLAAYGGGGLLWYLIVHNICLACIFCSLYVLRIDLISVARSYGFNVNIKRAEAAAAAAKDPNARPGFWKTFFLAIVLNKLLVPAQMLFTLATAPFLVKRLEPVAVILAPRCKALVVAIKSKITGKAPA